MDKHVVQIKKIFFIAIMALLCDLIVEVAYMSHIGVPYEISDIWGMFILLPFSILQGEVIDKNFKCQFFGIISIFFYPILIILIFYRRKIFSRIGKYLYLLFGILFILAFWTPIHRYWHLLSV